MFRPAMFELKSRLFSDKGLVWFHVFVCIIQGWKSKKKKSTKLVIHVIATAYFLASFVSRAKIKGAFDLYFGDLAKHDH